MNKTQQKARHYCMWEICLMQMIIHFMTTPVGILGEGSLREMLLINLGYGLQEIMNSILFLILYAPYPISCQMFLAKLLLIIFPCFRANKYRLNHIHTGIMYLMKHHWVLLLFGTPLRELRPISLSCPHTQLLVSRYFNEELAFTNC